MLRTSFRDIYLISGSGSLSLGSRLFRLSWVAWRSAMVAVSARPAAQVDEEGQWWEKMDSLQIRCKY